MSKSTLVTLAAIIAFVAAGAGLYLLKNSESEEVANEIVSSTTEEKRESITPAESEVPEAKLVLGDPNAEVTIVEYIDYKCPNCNRFHRGVSKEVLDEYGNQVNFEIRAYPAFGPDSGRALRGAYCALDQNVFTEYNDSVMNYMWDNYYENGNYQVEIEDVLTTDLLANLTSPTEIDIETFRNCVDSNEKNEYIDRDLLRAADDSITATPGFSIDGQTFVGLQPKSVFTALINRQL